VRLHDLLVAADLVGRGLLLAAPDEVGRRLGEPEVDVTAVVMDSRDVSPGSLFACVIGHVVDGHDFAPAAVAAGAAALIVQRRLDLAVPQVLVSDVRAALGPLSDALWGHPSGQLQVVGVTGTNGKTTTVALLAEIFEAHGWPASSLGTLTGARTTPEAPELQARLAELHRQGTRAVAMEVSSHALDQGRVDGVHFAAGVLTNVTQDHLDYHRTMEEYFEAKARLFEADRLDVAVINADDDYGQRLVGRLAGRVPTETFAMADAVDLEVTSEGSRFRWGGVDIALPLRGRFNVANALAAATAARALGIPAATVATGLARMASVRGRFEAVEAGQRFTVLVDYAHTPDGLAKALTAAREITSGRLIVVFGAGGDRDPSKRPLMGEVASRLADLAVVTSDNPRSEDPMAIIDSVVSGARDIRPIEEPDRRRAITSALGIADDGDVVLIAGKGHETGQDFGGRVEAFDDVVEAHAALERIAASRRDLRPGEANPDQANPDDESPSDANPVDGPDDGR
jgi:UDP-N-acetylmuramoyl-L-alanyl-D-glutamate--2,6-diaminopimelate ligase